MQILRAEHLGMCFGVRDAIDLAHRSATQGPLTILGDLVHNDSVLAELRARGIALEGRPEEVTTRRVMITAHGTSQRRMDAVRQRGHDVVEATCPLVHLAHRAVARLVAEGFHPVIVGQRNHVEVVGLTEDLAEFDVVLGEADIARLQPRDRFGVAAQTTQPIERVRHLVLLLRRRFPEAAVRFIDTVCQPTKLRQHAAVELAQRCDVVLVIGGAHSNNTRELVETCRPHCPRVHHIQGPEDLTTEWMAGVATLGITAGTSTPDALIDAVEQRVRVLASREVQHA